MIEEPDQDKEIRAIPGELGEIASNILNEDFRVERPAQKGATNVTEFKVKKLYLSLIIDLFDQEVISYELFDSLVLKGGEHVEKCTAPGKSPLPVDFIFRPGLAIPNARVSSY